MLLESIPVAMVYEFDQKFSAGSERCRLIQRPHCSTRETRRRGGGSVTCPAFCDRNAYVKAAHSTYPLPHSASDSDRQCVALGRTSDLLRRVNANLEK